VEIARGEISKTLTLIRDLLIFPRISMENYFNHFVFHDLLRILLKLPEKENP
jgi:hypothetical protein